MPFGSKVFAPVSILISLYALSSWINASALWVELPLMINILPEKWSLPSHLAFMIQCSNIAPVMYSIISKIKTIKSGRSISVVSKSDVTLSLLIICVSFLASILMAFLWDKTVFVAGEERSIAVLCLTGIFSLASCTSSLVYLPFMARFPAAYLSVFYFGLGLSGLLPGLIGLAQGLGSNPTCANSTMSNMTCDNSECTYVLNMVPVYPEPRFSIQTFLLIISCILFLSLLSFYALNFTRLKSYQVLHKEPGFPRMKHQIESESFASNPLNNDAKLEPSASQCQEVDVQSVESPDSSSLSSSKAQLSKAHLCFYLVSVSLLNLSTNGLIPATQSYTCLPYGDMVYTLTVRLSSVIGSLFSLSTLVLPIPGIKTIGFLMVVGVGTVIFHLTLALLSPHPPMVASIYGPIIIVSYFD